MPQLSLLALPCLTQNWKRPVDSCFLTSWPAPLTEGHDSGTPVSSDLPAIEASFCYAPCCLLFSRSVVSGSLQPCGLQHARLPCPSLSPGACSNSYPLGRWCHLTISSSVTPFSSCPLSFLASRVLSNELALCIKWPKYWSFSISPSNEYSGLISFMIDWCDRLAIQGDQSLSCAPSLSHKWSYRFLSTVLKSHLSLFHNVILMMSSIILLSSALKSFFWGS